MKVKTYDKNVTRQDYTEAIISVRFIEKNAITCTSTRAPLFLWLKCMYV